MILQIPAHTQLELQDLALFADIKDVPLNWSFDMDADFEPSALEALGLGRTFVPHSVKHAMAKFLARVFPDARIVHSHYETDLLLTNAVVDDVSAKLAVSWTTCGR